MTTNSKMNPATRAAAGRLYLKAGSSLNGAWCAKNETKVCKNCLPKHEWSYKN